MLKEKPKAMHVEALEKMRISTQHLSLAASFNLFEWISKDHDRRILMVLDAQQMFNGKDVVDHNGRHGTVKYIYRRQFEMSYQNNVRSALPRLPHPLDAQVRWSDGKWSSKNLSLLTLVQPAEV